MNIVSLFHKFEGFAHRVFSTLYSLKKSRHYYKLYRQNGIVIKKLTSEQKRRIRALWGGYDYSTHILYYSVTGEFDVRVCPELFFRTKLEPYLIDKRVNFAWGDKCYFDTFHLDLQFPHTIIRNIRGMYLNHDYQQISMSEAIRNVSANVPVIIKPSIASGIGRGVRKIEKEQDIASVLSHYNNDFVVQSIIPVCEEFKKLSPHAVCVIRIITLIVGGSSVVISSCLRLNTSDSIADNHITKDGRGMLVIGVKEDGSLKASGIYSCGEIINKLPNGIEFANVKIPNYEKACDKVRNAHMRMPMFKIIGWDVTIDEDLNPIVMEYNLKGIGIYYYQLVNGPLFGEHTERILRELNHEILK